MSCTSLAVLGDTILAGTHSGGVLRLDPGKGAEAAWAGPRLDSGLPIRDEANRVFHPVTSVAVDPDSGTFLVGSDRGIARRRADGPQPGEAGEYEECSGKQFRDRVTLPKTWLICSGEHAIEVVSGGEAE